MVQLLPRKGPKSKLCSSTGFPLQDKKKLTRDVISLVLARGPKMCSFIEYKDDLKIVYKRYARCLLVLSEKGPIKRSFNLFSALQLNLMLSKDGKLVFNETFVFQSFFLLCN